MARPPSLIRKRAINITMDDRLAEKLEAHLFSTVLARVPLGAYQTFFTFRTREFFEHVRLDLAPYLRQPEGAFIISGDPATIKLLTQLLEKENPHDPGNAE